MTGRGRGRVVRGPGEDAAGSPLHRVVIVGSGFAGLAAAWRLERWALRRAPSGVGFALVTRRQRAELGDVLLWGLGYGGFWWLLGALTLLPLARGMGVTWDLVGAQTAFASLVGHLAYGATVAAVLVALRRRHTWSRPPRVARLARGTGAGLLAASAVAAVCATSVGVPAWSLVVVGAAGGFGYPLIFGPTLEAAGPALVRGGSKGSCSGSPSTSRSSP